MRASSSVPTLVHFSVQHYIILDMMLTSITSGLDACVGLDMNWDYCIIINELQDPQQENRFRINKTFITRCHVKAQCLRILE